MLIPHVPPLLLAPSLSALLTWLTHTSPHLHSPVVLTHHCRCLSHPTRHHPDSIRWKHHCAAHFSPAPSSRSCRHTVWLVQIMTRLIKVSLFLFCVIFLPLIAARLLLVLLCWALRRSSCSRCRGYRFFFFRRSKYELEKFFLINEWMWWKIRFLLFKYSTTTWMINSFITSQALSSKAEVFKVAFVSDLKTDFKLLSKSSYCL